MPARAQELEVCSLYHFYILKTERVVYLKSFCRFLNNKHGKSGLSITISKQFGLRLGLCLLELSADNGFKTVWTQIRPIVMLGLIWIQKFYESLKKSTDNKKMNTVESNDLFKQALFPYIIVILCMLVLTLLI